MPAKTILAILLLVFGLLPAAAQDRFILVIDGSSSMWGEVGGETKIEVLRRSLGQVLGQLDTQADVGVVAFGHREKGNCADIEELVPPQPFDGPLIEAAINSIQPKGKTPLSDAVRFAAEEMRFTEEKATVVILGDGGENCGKDPCAVAEELEKLGVDLTVHAIAFDIADEEGSAQLQCFASATGGLFLPVADAPQLVAALETVQQVVESPKPETISFEAVDLATGATLNGPVVWSVTDRVSGKPVEVPDTSPATEVPLMPGDYAVRVTAGEFSAEQTVLVGPGQATAFQIAVPRPVAVLLDPMDSRTGTPVLAALDWQITEVSSGQVQAAKGQVGPYQLTLLPGEYLAHVRVGGTESELSFTVGKGVPVRIPVAVAMPEPARVRLIATDGSGRLTSGTVSWTFTDAASGAPITIDAESGLLTEKVPPGEYTVEAKSEGATGQGQASVAPAGITEVALVLVEPRTSVRLIAVDAATGASVVADTLNWTFVNTATEAIVEVTSVPNGGTTDTVPPGTYDVVVEAAGGYGEAQVTVSAAEQMDVTVQVTMPEAPLVVSATSVSAGTPVQIRWNFDGRESDLVFIFPTSEDDNRYPLDDDRRYMVGTTRSATLTAPAQPGEYEVRYFSVDAGGLVHRVPLLVLSPEGGLDGPGEAIAGETVEVAWTGPGLEGDFLFIAPYDWADDTYPMDKDLQVPASAGNPARLPVPEREGQYEYRYFSGSGGGVLFRSALNVLAPGAKVIAPASVVAGSAFDVEFTGPKDSEDRLFIAAAGSDLERYPLSDEARSRVQAGSPAALVAPAEPGDYEVRYYSLNKGGVLAVAPLTVTNANVEIDAPRLVQRASDVRIRIKGPMAPGDIAFVAPKDWQDNSYPLGDDTQLKLGPDGGGAADPDGSRVFSIVSPAEPGTYEIRYFSWENGTVLERRALIVK